MEEQIQAKVSSFHTDTCWITMMMLFNVGGILLLTLVCGFISALARLIPGLGGILFC